MAGFHAGYTNSAGAADTLITGANNVVFTAFGLGVVAQNAISKGDRLSVSIGQPLRSQSGSLSLDLPSGIDQSGNTVRSRTSLGLKADGRDTDAQGGSTVPLDARTAFSAAALVRTQPDNTANSAPEGVGMVRPRLRF